jgi:hypothetical protein
MTRHRGSISKSRAREGAGETARYEVLDYAQTRPLSAKGKLLWNRARKAGGGEKSRAVVSIDSVLLQRATQLAKQKGISRSQVMEQGLRKLLAG